MKPRVFVGSSKERLHFAKAVQQNLNDEADVTVWPQDVFQLSTYPLPSLTEMLDYADFGVFILGPDDIVLFRDIQCNVTRDNVIFETGMSIGRLGMERTFLILQAGAHNLHIPTDLDGFVTGTFDPNRMPPNDTAALGPACTEILTRIAKLGPIRATTEDRIYRRLEKVLFLTLQEIADTTGVRVQDIGLHLWILTTLKEPTERVLVRRVRVRIPDIPPSPTRNWPKGSGVVGQCWSSQSDVLLDLTNPIYQNLSDSNWNALSNDGRLGLSYSEFRDTTRYSGQFSRFPLEEKTNSWAAFHSMSNAIPTSHSIPFS